MSGAVKRDYRSELRAAQAQETRRSIVAAASRLFVENGYGATTIDAVAEAAGVSRKTVFTAVGGKLDLLKLTLDWSVAGDDQAVALSDRAAIRKLVDQPDPRGVLSGLVALLVAIGTRRSGRQSVAGVHGELAPASTTNTDPSTNTSANAPRETLGSLTGQGAPALRRAGPYGH